MKFEFKMGVIAFPRSFNGNGNLFQVKIVPDMEDIEETDLLPYFPNFFGQKDNAYQQDDVVWVLTNEDFTVGYIVGYAQGPAGDDITSFIQLVNLAEEKAGFDLSGYNDLSITRFGTSSIQYFNVNTGASGTIFNSKASMIVSAAGDIWMNNPGFFMYASTDGDLTFQGKSNKNTMSDKTDTITGDSIEDVGSKKIKASGIMSVNAGGDMNLVSGSNIGVSSVGDSTEVVSGAKKQTITGNSERTVISGSVTEEVLAGSYTITVNEGIASFTMGGGQINIFGQTGVNVSSSTEVTVSAPIVNTPKGTVVPTGTGGLCGLPFCLFTGAPQTGNVLTGG